MARQRSHERGQGGHPPSTDSTSTALLGARCHKPDCPSPGCSLCDLASSTGSLPTPIVDDGVATRVEDEVLVLVGSGSPGDLVVAPYDHVGNLSELGQARAAAFLGVLRRLSLAVRVVYRSSGATFEPVAPPHSAGGHVCFRVLPTTRDPEHDLVEDDAMVLARRISAAVASIGA